MTENFNPNNPFGDEKPKIVHFEKNESHYEMCRMQMHDIEHTHRRTFLANMVLCIIVCFLSIFHIDIQCFSLLSTPFMVADSPGMNLAGGIFQIILAMVVIIAGYLAWANFHLLNIFIATWYALMVILGIVKLDIISAVIGVVGFAFYLFAIQAMRREEALSELDGYPDFHEKFSIDKSDIVIQTLLAHKGEKNERPTFFNGATSLRKKRKPAFSSEQENHSSQELAEELMDKIAEKKKADAEKKAEAEKQNAEAPEESGMKDLTEELAAEEPSAAEAESVPEPQKPQNAPQKSSNRKKKKH